jgi:hypothetical protein
MLIFKILVLQALYDLSDEQAEYQLRDRLSFMIRTTVTRRDARPAAHRPASRAGRAHTAPMPLAGRPPAADRDSADRDSADRDSADRDSADRDHAVSPRRDHRVCR